MKTHLVLTLVIPLLWMNAYAERFDASVDFPPRVDLGMPVSGIVGKVAVSTGQHVSKDELLVTLVEAPFQAQVDLMQSHVDLQQARLDEALRDQRHQQEMYDRTVLSAVELENAQLRVRREQASLAGAKAELALANISYRNSRLKAPFDALVVSVDVNEGQTINNTMQTKTLVSLVRNAYFIAGFHVKPEQTEGLSLGQEVMVIIGKQQYSGNITAISYMPAGSGYYDDMSSGQRYRISAGFVVEAKSILAGKQAIVVVE